MGGDAHRRAVHHSAVVHYDNVGVRQVFQAVPLYRNRSRPSFFFAGEPSQNVGRSFIKSYCPVVNPDAAAVTMVWSYIGELVFNMLVLVGAVKMADRVVREMMGL